MTAVKQQQDIYFANFAALEKKLASSDPAWLGPIRKAAIDRFADLGFPTTKNEEWKYTSVAPIARTAFEPAPGDAGLLAVERRRHDTDAQHLVAARLTFVNGRYLKELSSTAALPPGVKVTSIAAALAGNGSTAASLENASPAGRVQPTAWRGREATNERRRFESVIATVAPAAAWARIAGAERSPA